MAAAGPRVSISTLPNALNIPLLNVRSFRFTHSSKKFTALNPRPASLRTQSFQLAFRLPDVTVGSGAAAGRRVALSRRTKKEKLFFVATNSLAFQLWALVLQRIVDSSKSALKSLKKQKRQSIAAARAFSPSVRSDPDDGSDDDEEAEAAAAEEATEEDAANHACKLDELVPSEAASAAAAAADGSASPRSPTAAGPGFVVNFSSLIVAEYPELAPFLSGNGRYSDAPPPLGLSAPSAERRQTMPSPNALPPTSPPRPSPSPLIPSPGSTGVDSTRTNILPFLLKGAYFLKYGRVGLPHFYFFRLSPDLSSLCRYKTEADAESDAGGGSSGAEKKGKANKVIGLRSIHSIKLGLGSSTKFQSAPGSFHASAFCLNIRGEGAVGATTVAEEIPLIAPSTNDYLIWTHGLSMLLGMLHEHDQRVLAGASRSSVSQAALTGVSPPLPPIKLADLFLNIPFESLANVATDWSKVSVFTAKQAEKLMHELH
jgi:hypothetical protein